MYKYLIGIHDENQTASELYDIAFRIAKWNVVCITLGLTTGMTDVLKFKEFFAQPKKIRVEVPDQLLSKIPQQLDEATRTTVGKFIARRDPPHFQGDEYHAHVDIPGGYEVAWGKSGVRRHPSKFPTNVPKDAKVAVAKVLGINVNLLEAYKVYDEIIGENVLLFEVSADEL